MRQGSTLHSGWRARVISNLWLVASVLVLFTVENIWIDRWLRNRSRHAPDLQPEALGGFWFLALIAITLFSIFLMMARVLVALDRNIPLLNRVGTGVATLAAVLLGMLWATGTVGSSLLPHAEQSSKRHSVTLTWNASKSPVKGYNVYRGTKSGGPYQRINPKLVQGLSYQDRDVRSGTTYYYVTRAVDADDREGPDSTEIKATVP